MTTSRTPGSPKSGRVDYNPVGVVLGIVRDLSPSFMGGVPAREISSRAALVGVSSTATHRALNYLIECVFVEKVRRGYYRGVPT